VTVDQSTIEYGDNAITSLIEDVGGDIKRVTLQVSEPGYWLIRGWLTTEPEVDALPSLVNPSSFDSPAAFFKVTDATGKLVIEVDDSGGGVWYIHSCVCGPVSVSSPIVIGL